MAEAVIVSAVRTPIGRANKGALKDVRGDDLAAIAVKAAVERVPGLDRALVEDVILGCAFPEGEQGMNMARLVGALAGLPETAGGVTVNRFCASSLQAVNMAAQNIMLGLGDVIVAGGVESMSRVPLGGFNPSFNPRLMPTREGETYSSPDRMSTRLNSSHVKISYAVFCLKKKKNQPHGHHSPNKNMKQRTRTTITPIL